MIQTMPGNLQPLDQKFPIVTPDGRPTLYFIKWAQQKQIDIGDAITLPVLEMYLAEHQLQQGSGILITPSGNLAESPTIAAEVQAILDQITNVRGSVLFRGAAGWEALAPGTNGYFLRTNGAGANPSWAAGGGGGGGFTPIVPVLVDWTRATNVGGGASSLIQFSAAALKASFTISGSGSQGKFFGVPLTTGVPFTVTARILIQAAGNDFSVCGLAIQGTTSTRTYISGKYQDTNTGRGSALVSWGFTNMSTNTTVAFAVSWTQVPQYFRISFDGTNLHAYASIDGYTWIETTLSGGVLPSTVFAAETISYAGIQLYGTAMSTNDVLDIIIDSFEITYP